MVMSELTEGEIATIRAGALGVGIAVLGIIVVLVTSITLLYWIGVSVALLGVVASAVLGARSLEWTYGFGIIAAVLGVLIAGYAVETAGLAVALVGVLVTIVGVTLVVFSVRGTGPQQE
jgi:hypothetical protein